jgi:hypothetical protein
VYEAYYDASRTGVRGRLSDAITLACLVAPAKVWIRFSDAWNAAMKRGGAEGKILHMKDLVHGVGDWTGWKDSDKQAALFRKLLPVCRKFISHGFCLSYPTFYWNQATVISTRPTSPLHELFQAAMDGMMTVMKPTESDPVHSFMEQDELVEHDITRHFYYLARAKGRERIFPSMDSLPKGPAPLQAADMVAYEGSRFISEQVQTSIPRRPPRRLYKELWRFPQFHFRHMHLEDFIRLATASTLAGEQIRRTPEIKAALDAAFDAAGKQTQRERSARGKERKKKSRERKK